MQKADKMNEITGSAEQNLPVGPAAVAGEELPFKSARAAVSRLDQDKTEASGAVGSSQPAATNTAAATSDTTIQVSATGSMRAVERMNDMMALHSVRLRDSGNDSMQVIIKPGSGLQLSLNLQMRDGAVEVSAQLHRGDYNFLSQHWSELQQQLEARGIRLAPLTCSEQAMNGNANFSQQSGRQSSDEQTTKTGAFAEFALNSQLVPKPSTKTTIARGWESWA